MYMKTRIRKRKRTMKRTTRKKMKGGIGFSFFSDASYLLQNSLSFLSDAPVPPVGNTSIQAPFPFIQNK